MLGIPSCMESYLFVQCDDWLLKICCRTGGMADAGDSKSPAREGVPVQVRGPVVDVKSKQVQCCTPFIQGSECY